MSRGVITFAVAALQENINVDLVWFEPTDIFKASKPFLNKSIPFPKFISPNFLEFKKIFEIFYPDFETSCEKKNVPPINECIEKGYLMSKFIENIIITLGEEGVMVIRRGKATDPFYKISNKRQYIKGEGEVSHRLYKTKLLKKKDIVNVSGAGDCFASGFIAAMLNGGDEETCIDCGVKCSIASIKSSKTVPSEFSN